VLIEANVSHVDIMVLDLEGAEHIAVQSLNFDATGIGVLIAESDTGDSDSEATNEKSRLVQSHLSAKGMIMLRPGLIHRSDIFVNRTLLQQACAAQPTRATSAWVRHVLAYECDVLRNADSSTKDEHTQDAYAAVANGFWAQEWLHSIPFPLPQPKEATEAAAKAAALRAQAAAAGTEAAKMELLAAAEAIEESRGARDEVGVRDEWKATPLVTMAVAEEEQQQLQAGAQYPVKGYNFTRKSIQTQVLKAAKSIKDHRAHRETLYEKAAGGSLPTKAPSKLSKEAKKELSQQEEMAWLKAMLLLQPYRQDKLVEYGVACFNAGLLSAAETSFEAASTAELCAATGLDAQQAGAAKQACAQAKLNLGVIAADRALVDLERATAMWKAAVVADPTQQAQTGALAANYNTKTGIW
jgi:hypothetical protein